MNIPLFLLSVILSAISTIAIPIWDNPLNENTFFAWVDSIRDQYGLIDVWNSTDAQCPSTATDGCLQLVPASNASISLVVDGFNNIYFNYRVAVGPSGLQTGESCNIYVSDGQNTVHVDGYSNPDAPPEGGKSGSVYLPEFLDPVPFDVIITVSAESQAPGEPTLKCFFSDLELWGDSSVTSTQFQTTNSRAGPADDCQWIYPIESSYASYPVPSGACLSGNVGGMAYSEKYSCTSPTTMERAVFDTYDCDGDGIGLSGYNHFETAFNCNASSACNAAHFQIVTACNGDAPDYTAGYFEGYYVTDGCLWDPYSGRSTFISCVLGADIIIGEYSDTLCANPISSETLSYGCDNPWGGIFFDLYECGSTFTTAAPMEMICDYRLVSYNDAPRLPASLGCFDVDDGYYYYYCRNQTTLAVESFEPYSGCGTDYTDRTLLNTQEGGVGSCASYGTNSYCDGDQLWFATSNACDGSGNLITDPGYQYARGYLVLHTCLQTVSGSVMASCYEQYTIQLHYYSDASCGVTSYQYYVSSDSSCEINPPFLQFDCSEFTGVVEIENICDYRLVYGGMLPASLGCIDGTDGDYSYSCQNQTTLAVESFEAYSGCGGDFTDRTLLNTEAGGIGSCAGYGTQNNYCNGDQLWFETSNECDDSGNLISDPGYQYAWGHLVLHECLQIMIPELGDSPAFMTASCDSQYTIRLQIFTDTSCATSIGETIYIDTSCETNNALRFDCSSFTGGESQNICDYRFVYGGRLPATLGCFDGDDGYYYYYCRNQTTLAVESFEPYSGCGTDYTDRTLLNTQQEGIGSCAGYGTQNNYCDGNQLWFQTSNGCDDSGNIISDTGYQYAWGHLVLHECLQTISGSMTASCDNQYTIRLIYFSDAWCGSFNYEDYISTSCETNNALQFDCSYFTGGSDGEESDRGYSIPRENIYCPWILHDGPASVIGPNLCNMVEQNDVTLGSYHWECVDYGMVQYTNYSDPYCSGAPDTVTIGQAEHCQGCGYIVGDWNEDQILFDCSWYDMYNETACNHVYYVANDQGCYPNGTMIKEGRESLHVVTDICFGDGEDSMKIQCVDDALSVQNYNDSECQILNPSDSFGFSRGCNSADGGAVDFTCVTGNIPVVEEPDTNVYCPWIVTNLIPLKMVAGICMMIPGSSLMYECQDYGVMKYSVYTNNDCSGDPQESYDIGTYDAHCDGCGPVQDVFNGSDAFFDCSHYQRYDQNNCNRIRWQQQNDSGCTSDPDTTVTEVNITFVQDACTDASEGYTKAQCSDSGGWDIVWYQDSNCNIFGERETVASPGCNSTTNVRHIIDCLYGEIPYDQGGDDKDRGTVYLVGDILCPWYADNDDMFGKAFDFCTTKIDDIDNSGNELFIAEYYTCIADDVMMRTAWLSTEPIQCSAKAPNLTQHISSSGGVTFESMDINLNTESISNFLDREWLFDCSNYDRYNKLNPYCSIIYLNASDYGCDESGNLHANQTSGAYITDVCWATQNNESYELSTNENCDSFLFGVYKDSSCNELDFTLPLADACDNVNPSGESNTLALEMECVSHEEYAPVIEPPCPYAWGLYDPQDSNPTSAGEGLIHSLNVCEQDGASNSSTITCRGTSTLIYTQYATPDCTGTYTETEVAALQYRCDGIRDDCDLLEYTTYAECGSATNSLQQGEWILGICLSNGLDSFTTTCDAQSLQMLYYSTTDCSGVPDKNNTVYTGCDKNPHMNIGRYLEATCEYTETTTTTTSAPVAGDVNITFEWSTPESGKTIKDPYALFKATALVMVEDPDAQATCEECFIWQIMDKSATEPVWEDIDPLSSESIDVFRSLISDDGTTTVYRVTLVISSIRKLKQSKCFDPLVAADHIFSPGNTDGYSFRLRAEFVISDYDASGDLIISDTSDARTVTTNYLPSGGTCDIIDIESKTPLDPIYFNCSGWTGNAVDLQYNALIGDLFMSDVAVTDVSLLTTRAPLGEFSVTILLIDDLGAATCYDIAATFQEITAALATQSNEELKDKLLDVTDSVDLGEDVSTLAAVVSLRDGLQESGGLTEEEVQEFNEIVIDNFITTKPFDSTDENDTEVEVTVVTNFLAGCVILTDNSDGLDTSADGGAVKILDTVDDDFFYAMDNILSQRANDTEGGDNTELQGEVLSTVELLFELTNNIGEKVTTSNTDLTEEETVELNNLGEKLENIDSKNLALAISVAETDETYVYSNEVLDDEGNVVSKKEAGAKKTDTTQYKNKGILEQPSIVIGNQGMMLPAGIGDETGGGIDITVSIKTPSYYKPKNKSYKGYSPDVSINLFETGSSRRRRRRRLLSNSKIEYNASDCFPYFVFIDTDNTSVVEAANQDDWSLKEGATFPSCRYWDGTTAEWNPDGCFVYNVSNVSVVCACRHLTTFQLSADDFVPEANILTFRDLRDVTPENLMKYPAVWIVFVVFVAIFVIIGYLNPNKGNEGRSIVAYEDMIYHDVRKEKMETDYSGKQVHAFSVHTPNQDKIGQGLLAMGRGSGDKMCRLHFNLFVIQLRNDHTLLSVVQRTAGTNFSTRQRLACFFMYLATIMVASAIFYGVEQKAMGDVSASFLMSLLSTAPVLVVKQLFMKAKPTVIGSSAKEDYDGDGIIDELDEEGPQNTTIRQQKIGQLKMSKTVTDTLSIVEKKKMQTTIRELNATIRKVHLDKNKSRAHRIALVEKIRVVMFQKLYPLPPWCKKLAWIILILWATACAIIAITYGIQFDLRFSERENWLGQCWQNYRQLVIERDLSEEQVQELQDSLNPHRSDNFPGAATSSTSWLLSLVMSLILSLILWQPLTVYVTTWIMLWMFTWNISMGLGPGSLMGLINRACCRNKAASEELDQLNKQLSAEAADGASVDLNSGSVVAHEERPLDLIGFLGNDTLFLDRYDHEAATKDKEVELVTVTAGASDKEKEELMSDSEDKESGDKDTKQEVLSESEEREWGNVAGTKGSDEKEKEKEDAQDEEPVVRHENDEP